MVVGTAIVPMPCGNILPPPAAWSSHTFMMLIPLLLMRFRDTMKPLDIQCVRAHCSGTCVDNFNVSIKHFLPHLCDIDSFSELRGAKTIFIVVVQNLVLIWIIM